MDNAKQSRSFFRRVGDFFYNWANGSEWSQLDAIMLAVGLWLFGCLIIGGFFAANWIQSLTPTSKKHEMLANIQQAPGTQGHTHAIQQVQAMTQGHQPMPTHMPQAVPLAAPPQAVQFAPQQSYALAPTQVPMPHPMYSEGRSARLYSNRSHGGSAPYQAQVHPQAYVPHSASIPEPYVPRYQKYEVLSDFPKYSETEVAQKFGAPRVNADFPNWKFQVSGLGQSSSGEANAFGAVP